MKVLLSISFLVIFTSCGQKPEETLINPATPEKYEYEFYDDQAKCETGLHEYYYLEDACEALLNEEINNNCAHEKRVKLYESSCNY